VCLEEICLVLLRLRKAVEHPRFRRARANNVDPNAGAGEFDGRRLRDAFHDVLAADITGDQDTIRFMAAVECILSEFLEASGFIDLDSLSAALARPADAHLCRMLIRACAIERVCQHFVHGFNRDELQFLLRFFRNLYQVLLVQLWDQYCGNAGAHRGKTLLF